jgi:hypothetical protein
MAKEGDFDWVRRIQAVFPSFPNIVEPNEHIYDIEDDLVTRKTPLGWVLDEALEYEPERRDGVIQLLLDMGANPHTVGMSLSDEDGTDVWMHWELVNDCEEMRILLEAGVIVRIPVNEWLRWDGKIYRMIKAFHRNSFRATAVVWCLEALRGTSSWPDMAFLLTRIMMDVSK